MMCLSQTTGYAIHGLAHLANLRQPCLIREAAEATGIPKPYLAKIINQLSRKGLVAAKRGYCGGIFLTRPAAEITLLQVVEAIEGKKWIGECMLGLDYCAARSVCPTHAAWQRIRGEIEGALGRTTLADVIKAAKIRELQMARGRRRGPPSLSHRKESAPEPLRAGKRSSVILAKPSAGFPSIALANL